MRVRHHVFTSAQHGVGTYAGFRTVLSSPSLSAVEVRRLETFSVYSRPRQTDATPASFSSFGFNPGEICVSRIVDAGEDFSGRRGNYFAHNVIVSAAELQAAAGGDPFVLLDRGVFRDDLTGLQNLLPDEDVTVKPTDAPTSVAWLRGLPSPVLSALVQSLLDACVGHGDRLFLVPPSETERGQLFRSLVRVLPRRWRAQLTFSSYRWDDFPSFLKVIGVWPDARGPRRSYDVHARICDMRGCGTTIVPAATVQGLEDYTKCVVERIHAGSVAEEEEDHDAWLEAAGDRWIPTRLHSPLEDRP
jgi:hypothetical protein